MRLRVGRPLTFPHVETPSRELAAAVTDRIWPCVMLQWEWLGGLPPLRRAAVLGDGAWAAPLTRVLERAGIAVDGDLERADLVVVTTPVTDVDVTAIRPGAGVLFAGGRLDVPQARTATLGSAGDVWLIATDDRGIGRQLRDVFTTAGREATVERVAA